MNTDQQAPYCWCCCRDTCSFGSDTGRNMHVHTCIDHMVTWCKNNKYCRKVSFQLSLFLEICNNVNTWRPLIFFSFLMSIHSHGEIKQFFLLYTPLIWSSTLGVPHWEASNGYTQHSSVLAVTVKSRKSQDFLAPISGSPGDQIFSLTFRNSTSVFLNTHLWSKIAILKLNNT